MKNSPSDGKQLSKIYKNHSVYFFLSCGNLKSALLGLKYALRSWGHVDIPGQPEPEKTSNEPNPAGKVNESHW